MGTVIPTARAFNVNIDQVCAAMAQMTKNGISTAESSTYLNGMLSELGKSGTRASDALKESTGKTFSQLMQSGAKLSDVLNVLKENADKNNLSLADMFGNIRAGKGALTLVKGEGEEFNGILQQMTNSAGATDTAFSKVADTSAARLKKKLNELKNEGIELGEKMIPLVEKGIEFLGKLADKFNNLSDEQQENILKWGALAMAIGPVLKIVGGGISTIGTMGTSLMKLSGTLGTVTSATSALGTASSVAGGTSGIGALAGGLGSVASVAIPLAVTLGAIAGTAYVMYENNELLNTSINTTAEELSPLQRLWNNMDGGIIKTKEEMEDLGLIHHEWSSNVAPETQEAINATAKKWQELNLQIDHLKTNNIALESSSFQTLKQQTDSICNDIISQIKSKQTEANKELGEYFNVDKSIDTYEQTLLSYFDSSSLKQQQKVQECTDKINAIYQKAADQHREIYESEYAAIKKYQEDMANIQINTLAKANEEMLELQANFNAKMRTADLDQTSEMMQEKAQKRDEDIASTNEYYNTKIEMLSNNIANMNEPQRIAAQEEINKLKEERDKKLKINRETYDGYIKTLEEKYPEIADRIDEFTGKILSDGEYSKKKSFENQLQYYKDIENITESGMTKLYNTSTKTWDDVYVNVDQNTGKINGVWNKSRDELIAYNNDINDSLGKLTSNYNHFTNNQKQAILSAIMSNNSYDANTKAVASSVISQLQGTGREVNGLYTEVINCNGTPVKVQVNKDGTIANIEEIKGKLASIPRAIPISCMVRYYNADTGESWNGNKNVSYGYGYDANGNAISHYNGLDYVPYDGYNARLHKGERVLTADENKKYDQLMQHIDNKSINGNITVHSVLNLDGKVVASNQDIINGRNIQLERRLAGLC